MATVVDELTPVAAALGVCNCLYRVDGTDRIAGHSTDGDGFVAAFRSRFGRDLAGLSVLIVGAGGAARSIVEAVGRAGADRIVLANRTIERAEQAAGLASTASAVAMADLGPNDVAAVDVVVNTTAVGMAGGPAPDEIPIPVDGLRAGHLVVDIVYQPRITPLLSAAGQIGAQTDGGLSMLIGQAALAFELWTGSPAPIEAMTAAVDQR